MAFGDLVPYREIGSNTIIKGNIDENVSIVPILLKIVTLVKFPGEDSERVMDTKMCITNALSKIIQRIIINPLILGICIVDMLPWLQKMAEWDFKIFFLEMNDQTVIDLNTKNGMSKCITFQKLQ